MWTKQQQRHDYDNSVDRQAPKTRTPYAYDDSWEEQAFAEDAAGALGGCIWPPRSYSCSFCRREFRSAQALGGHMNVHRRDRARLKQSPNPQNNNQNPFTSLAFPCPSRQVCTLVYDNVPNPKTHHPSSHSGFHSFPSCSSSAMTDEYNRQSTAVISCSRPKSSAKSTGEDKKTRISGPTVKDKDYVKTGFSDANFNFGFRQSRPTSVMSDSQEEAATSCKRRKTDDAKSIQFYVKSSTSAERHHHHIQSEVIGLSSTSLKDLDLELRLGGLSKLE